MKKNPGRKERRRTAHFNKIQDGKRRAKVEEYRQKHPWIVLKKEAKRAET